MRFDHSKATVRTVLVAVCILLLGASWAAAQQQVNLVAGPAMAVAPAPDLPAPRVILLGAR